MKPCNQLLWKNAYADLKLFFEEYGHSRVPYRHKENPSLGAWVCKQRTKEDKLTAKQIAQLNQLNFIWSAQIRKDHNQYFSQMFRKLQKYKEVYGNYKVPFELNNEFKDKTSIAILSPIINSKSNLLIPTFVLSVF